MKSCLGMQDLGLEEHKHFLSLKYELSSLLSLTLKHGASPFDANFGAGVEVIG